MNNLNLDELEVTRTQKYKSFVITHKKILGWIFGGIFTAFGVYMGEEIILFLNGF